MRSGFPEFMLKEERETWDIALALVTIIADADEGRRITGRLWKGTFWEPGCKVCALGYIYEQVVPIDRLKEVNNSNARMCQVLKPEIEKQTGPVSAWNFTGATSLVMRLNDQLNLPFAETARVVREAYDEQFATG